MADDAGSTLRPASSPGNRKNKPAILFRHAGTPSVSVPFRLKGCRSASSEWTFAMPAHGRTLSHSMCLLVFFWDLLAVPQQQRFGSFEVSVEASLVVYAHGTEPFSTSRVRRGSPSLANSRHNSRSRQSRPSISRTGRSLPPCRFDQIC